MASLKGSSARKTVIVLSLVFLVLFLINILPEFFTGKVRTVLPVSDEYKQIISSHGLILRDEKVYENPYSGEIFRVVLEGERVPYGAEVANVLLGADLTGQKSELIEIEKSIDLLQIENRDYSSDILSRLQYAISIEDYSTAHNLKSDLMMQLDFMKDYLLSDPEGIIDKLNELKQKRDSLKSTIDDNVKRLYSSNSGIVSFVIDGYEELLNPYELDKFKADYFNVREADINKNAAFKIVDGFDWVLAVKSTENSLEVGNTYEVVIRIDDEKVLTLRAPLIEAKEDMSGFLYFFRSNILLSELYNVRQCDVDIVKLKVSSLRIPKEVVFDKEGKLGVYVKEFYGVVRFRPIKVVGEDEKFVYIEHGDSYGYIEDEYGKRFKTINIYTEVLFDSERYFEGEIID